jgi:hypothetical protein
MSGPALAEGHHRPVASVTPATRTEAGCGDSAGSPSVPPDSGSASWSPEDFDVAEWVCRPHAFDYSLEGRSRRCAWAEIDRPTQKVVAYNAHINQQEQETSIWMDGRPHPPANTIHTWSGFSTGVWEGDVLIVTTTHLKETYMRRTGVMRAIKATIRTPVAPHGSICRPRRFCTIPSK